jgi:hypothetical protein
MSKKVERIRIAAGVIGPRSPDSESGTPRLGGPLKRFGPDASHYAAGVEPDSTSGLA